MSLEINRAKKLVENDLISCYLDIFPYLNRMPYNTTVQFEGVKQLWKSSF